MVERGAKHVENRLEKGGKERRKEKGKSFLKTTIRTFFPKISLQN